MGETHQILSSQCGTRGPYLIKGSALKYLQPILDAQLGEDVAWRLEAMNRSWELDGEILQIPILVWRSYRQPSEAWDHDHCVGCNVRFSSAEIPGALKAGWATLHEGGSDLGQLVQPEPIHLKDGSTMLPSPIGASEWLCPDCHRLLMEVASGRIVPQWMDL